jgi:hypothetical protein
MGNQGMAEFPTRARGFSILQSVHIDSVANLASYSKGIRATAARGVQMTAHLYLMLRLCIYGAVPSLPSFSIMVTYSPNLKIIVFLSTKALPVSK